MLLVLALLLPVSLRAEDTTVPPTGSTSTNATVLVVIDVQQFYFPGGTMPLQTPEAASAQARRLLARFRTNGWPVVHVQHLPAGQSAPSPDAGDPQYRIHPDVMPTAGEAVIGKHHANAFRDTPLLPALQKLGARRLVLAGMQTHMCVEAAARAAADAGFEVVVASDACATRSLKYQDVEVPAVQVHAATLAALNSAYARVLSTEELLTELASVR
ncbi:MAG: cysteine hydrolase [Verrucomicrobiales bacterium]|nr:cysteine hydrolase [Verrucomicrobiales bacterium]